MVKKKKLIQQTIIYKNMKIIKRQFGSTPSCPVTLLSLLPSWLCLHRSRQTNAPSGIPLVASKLGLLFLIYSCHLHHALVWTWHQLPSYVWPAEEVMIRNISFRYIFLTLTFSSSNYIKSHTMLPFIYPNIKDNSPPCLQERPAHFQLGPIVSPAALPHSLSHSPSSSKGIPGCIFSLND